MHKHEHHHHHHHGHSREGRETRFALPLADHPFLDFATDFAHLTIVRLQPGEEPRVELRGYGDLPEVEVRGESGTTHVRVGGILRGRSEENAGGRFWDSAFWEKRRWKRHFHFHIVLHVPADVHARVRSSAAHVEVRELSACDLTVEIAGALELYDVIGRLRLSTSAGRIDGRAIGGTLDVTTTAGAVRLDVVSLDAGAHRVRTSMGAAHVDLARGIPMQINTRTALGSARVDYPSTRGAPVVLDIEADLGAIRVSSSRRVAPAPPVSPGPVGGSPYRTADARTSETPAPPIDDAEIEKILQRVAEGALSPVEARDMLRALGWA